MAAKPFLFYMQTLYCTSNFFKKDNVLHAWDNLRRHILKEIDANRLSLPWPGAKFARRRIVPVFLPFAGCAVRCIFCSQESQTGVARANDLAAVRECLARAREALFTPVGDVATELAFYGGTFTAQPEEAFNLCLEFAAEMRLRKKIDAFRCSTRPDCVNPEILRAMREHGCEMVEFGVQSFSERALKISRRGYGPEDAKNAIRLAGEVGLRCCAQLMPGMPGQEPDEFVADVALAARLGVDALRFYPCQVLEGTALAGLWRNGAYKPWSLVLALRQLSRGLLLANIARIPVIRTGLAPQAALAPLAGPSHPALGGLIRARALMLGALLLAKSVGTGDFSRYRLLMPENAQGYWAGQKNRLLPLWRRLGFAQFAFENIQCLALERL